MNMYYTTRDSIFALLAGLVWPVLCNRPVRQLVAQRRTENFRDSEHLSARYKLVFLRILLAIEAPQWSNVPAAGNVTIAQNSIVFRDMYLQCPIVQCAE